MPEDVNVEMKVDTSGFDKALDDLQKKSDLFGRTLTSALKSAAVSGKGLDDILRQVGMSIAGMALNAGLKRCRMWRRVFSPTFSGDCGAKPSPMPKAALSTARPISMRAVRSD